MQSLTITRDQNVVQIQLNRPAKKNALTLDMYRTIAETVEAAEADTWVRAILFVGSGGNFTSGNDLDDFPDPLDDQPNPVLRFVTALVKSSVPMVAAIEGLAVGIGATMLAYFDSVVADEDTRILYPFINLALPPEAGSTLLLPQLLGYTKAAQLLMLGKPLRGKEAFEAGIVSNLSPVGQTQQCAMQIAKEFAKKPPAMMRQTKKMLRGETQTILQRIKDEEQALHKALLTNESKEAIQALIEKRPADFS